MVDDVTDRARRVLVLAQDEARQSGHAQVGTEHLLLGLARQSDDEAIGQLKPFNVTRQAVAAIIERGHTTSAGDALPLSPRAEKVLELASREAFQLGHDQTDSEHLLMALVREGNGTGARVLTALGVDLGQAHRALRERLVLTRPTITASVDQPTPSSEVSAFVLALSPERRRALREHPAEDAFALAATWSNPRDRRRIAADLAGLPEYRQARVRLGRITRPAARARYQAAALHGDRTLAVAMAHDHDRKENTTLERVDELNTYVNNALRGLRKLRRAGDEQRATGILAVLADLDRAHDIAGAIAAEFDVELARDVVRDLERARRAGREVALRLAVDRVRDQTARQGNQVDLPELDRAVTFVIDYLVDARTADGATEDERTLNRLLRDSAPDRLATLAWLHGALAAKN